MTRCDCLCWLMRTTSARRKPQQASAAVDTLAGHRQSSTMGHQRAEKHPLTGAGCLRLHSSTRTGPAPCTARARRPWTSSRNQAQLQGRHGRRRPPPGLLTSREQTQQPPMAASLATLPAQLASSRRVAQLSRMAPCQLHSSRLRANLGRRLRNCLGSSKLPAALGCTAQPRLHTGRHTAGFSRASQGLAGPHRLGHLPLSQAICLCEAGLAQRKMRWSAKPWLEPCPSPFPEVLGLIRSASYACTCMQ